MKYIKKSNCVFVRLERGEEIIEKLQQLIEKEKILTGKVTGIGACDEVTIGNFDLRQKQYNQKTLRGSYEIINLSGNISSMDGKPYLHLHITLADEELRARGGHLNKGIISATAELIIEIYECGLDRFRDEGTGLNLWKL